jgi:mannose-6-phosphate isomerase-like protein (cupin superfamily)
MKTEYARITAFVTKDGSEIRELMHPSVHAVRNQSLAEAIVHPGQTTLLHRHRMTEELYHITAGRGRMTLGDSTLEVGPGDTVCIPPGTPHCVANASNEPLHILCACTPPYAHEDTELLEPQSGNEA